ncbi:GntR family transcriptional regulator [Bradyrhizobium sp. CCBAU 051011]|uniref:MocR-like pyridoxine biosynthesis transcription factor PdxR n=1 Tax=Bradyrhizobium sp. CCBAU 051011 TaxID=858422 RepID=UPI0013742D67|nr:PLP-dependent aminotransferase family protein [Bradyrhizobium sp. CCBAU 051011]QHO72425.1 GntR family transcriptional regulator [Bradyrhizobium sp. CCBAU 051011]
MDELLPGMLHLARDGGETLTRQLTDQLRGLITGGHLAPGQRLPSSRQLAKSLALSRNTVTFAIEQLAAEGYLSSSAGRRPIVVEGLSLDRRKALPRSNRAGGGRIELSSWARSLQRANWPPVHDGRPRPFQPGLADEREFPHDAWSCCLRRAARNAPLRRDRPINHPPLQEALLRHLVVHRGIKATPGQILIVPTAQAGLTLVANALLERGDHAWIESPGYGGANVALAAAGATVSAIPLDAQGMAIAAPEDTPRLIFVTPSHQYPTGRLMPIGRRLELLRYAEAASACIIEDDYDGEFHYEARPVAALQGLAPSPRVFYLGTFSKATYADIRFGYVVVPEAHIETFERAQRHMGMLTSITMQDALAEFITSGAYLGHIRRMTRLYKGRRDRMLQALAAEAGDRLAIEVPAGGMQLLARCHPHTDDQKLSARLDEAGVVSRPLSSMLYHRSGEQGLFLGFAAWNEKEIDQAARILGRIVR